MANGRILITGSGVSKGFCKEQDIVVLDSRGKKISGKRDPSSEVAIHLCVYEERPEINAVFHAHPPGCVACTIAGVSLAQCILPEVILSVGSIPTTEYATPTSLEGPEVVREFLKKGYNAIILDRHGSLTLGKDLFEAYNRLETMEQAANVTILARQMGSVRTLSRDQVQKLVDIRRQFGHQAPTNCCEDCNVCREVEEASKPPDTKLIEIVTEEVRKVLDR